MRALDRGEDFIVTSNGRPVAELRPIRPRRFVPREALVASFADAPQVDYERLRADVDALGDQDPTPRVWRES